MNKAVHRFLFCILLASAGLAACNRGTGTKQAVAKQPCKKVASFPVKYAKGFTIDYYDGFKVITVKDPIDTLRPVARYVIHRPGKHYPVGFEDAVLIDTPVRKVVCISTSHVAEMDKLGLTDSISAVTNVSWLYNSKVVEKVRRHEIADAGNDEIDYEKLVELHPSFVFTSGSYDGGDKLKIKLEALHITSVLDLEYKEQDPLARAEWLKFIAAFYGREHEADSIFNIIEANYISLKEKVKNVTLKPTVFCNMPFKEIWYMPCGENYIARLIADAGGDFLWKDATATNGLNLSLDYESVYAKAANADFWINQGFASSLKEIKAADKKNALFKAWKTGEIYNNNKRNTPAGGFDFWETGVVNPDKILADLIYIFHPELMQGHELYYYQSSLIMKGDQRNIILFVFLSLLLGFAFLLQLFWGSVQIPFHEVLQVLRGTATSNEAWANIIIQSRLPGALAALFAGAGLSIGGLQMQTLFRNPVAEPYVLGISAGASLGVAVFIMASTALGLSPQAHLISGWSIIMAASAGAVLIFICNFLIAYRIGDVVAILIIGLMIGGGISALIEILQSFSSNEALKNFVLWTFGSFRYVNMDQVAYLITIVVVAIILSFALSKPLNLLLMGDNYAISSGLNIRAAKIMIVLCTSVLAGSITAFCGPIGFVGLAVPHISRSLFRTADHKILIPASALIGAIVCCFCNILASGLGSEHVLPVNAITSLLGAPAVIWIILKQRKI